jgi:hypothetical protein
VQNKHNGTKLLFLVKIIIIYLTHCCFVFCNSLLDSSLNKLRMILAWKYAKILKSLKDSTWSFREISQEYLLPKYHKSETQIEWNMSRLICIWIHMSLTCMLYGVYIIMDWHSEFTSHKKVRNFHNVNFMDVGIPVVKSYDPKNS